MAGHAEDALRGAGIAQVLDLLLAVAAAEAVGAEGLVAREDGQVFDLVAAVVAAIRAVVAYQRAVAQQQQVGVRVEQGAARVAAEAVNVPSVAGCAVSVSVCMYICSWRRRGGRASARDGRVSEGNAYQAQRPCLPRESGLHISTRSATGIARRPYLAAALARIHDIVLVQR